MQKHRLLHADWLQHRSTSYKTNNTFVFFFVERVSAYRSALNSARIIRIKTLSNDVSLEPYANRINDTGLKHRISDRRMPLAYS
jgi:hypothetical protein